MDTMPAETDGSETQQYPVRVASDIAKGAKSVVMSGAGAVISGAVAARSAKDLIAQKIRSMPESESKEVEQLCRTYDADGNGEYSVDEVKAIILDLRSSQNRGKMLKWFVLLLVLCLLLAIGAIFGVSYLAVETAKESHVSKEGAMTSTSGSPVKIESASYDANIYALVSEGSAALATLRSLDCYLDASAVATTSHPELGGKTDMEATFEVTGAVMPTETSAVLLTSSSAQIVVDASAQTLKVRHPHLLTHAPHPRS